MANSWLKTQLKTSIVINGFSFYSELYTLQANQKPKHTMATENIVLMRNARESLEGKWLLAVGTFLVAMLIISVAESVLMWIPFGGIAVLLVSAPISLGLAMFSLNIARNKNAELEQMFDGFKNFGTAFLAYLLMFIFTFLWTLLLIVPGIIAALSYALTPYIIVENPEIQPMDAIDKSKEMMDGYKAKLFRLYLRFFGWALLCILTFGIGFLWLVPYVGITMAKFYDDVKAHRNGGAEFANLTPDNNNPSDSEPAGDTDLESEVNDQRPTGKPFNKEYKK